MFFDCFEKFRKKISSTIIMILVWPHMHEVIQLLYLWISTTPIYFYVSSGQYYILTALLLLLFSPAASRWYEYVRTYLGIYVGCVCVCVSVCVWRFHISLERITIAEGQASWMGSNSTFSQLASKSLVFRTTAAGLVCLSGLSRARMHAFVVEELSFVASVA